MPPSRLQPLYPNRRRRSSLPAVLIILLLLVIGLLVYLAMIDTGVPTARVEQDVTNALPAR